jgi:hypothetical protein
MMSRVKLTPVLLLLFLVLSVMPLHAEVDSRFVGEWNVEITAPETARPPYQVEIKYPKWMKIELVDGKLTGTYIDQFDYRCTFPAIEAVNGGKDLLFVMCGTTKHPESFAPVHHAKVIDGKMVGVTLTREKLFEWKGQRVSTRPLEEPTIK